LENLSILPSTPRDDFPFITSDKEQTEMEEKARGIALNQLRMETLGYCIANISYDNQEMTAEIERQKEIERRRIGNNSTASADKVQGENSTNTFPQSCSGASGGPCPIDHHATRWARTMHGRNKQVHYIEIEVLEDTGAQESWISLDIVQMLDLRSTPPSNPNQEYIGANGARWNSQGEVDIKLSGINLPVRPRCQVAPLGFPIQGVALGSKFVQQHGHVHTLFSDKKGEPHLVIARAPKTVCFPSSRWLRTAGKEHAD
jgi:hypothetical protein